MKKTKIPLINSVEMVLLNIISSIILSYWMGLNDLALGSSISSIFGAINLYFKLTKKIGKIKIQAIKKNVIKMLISAFAMAIISKEYIFCITFEIIIKFKSFNCDDICGFNLCDSFGIA